MTTVYGVDIFINDRSIITQKHSYETTMHSPALCFTVLSVSELLLNSYDTRSLLHSSSTLQAFITPIDFTHFDSIRLRTG